MKKIIIYLLMLALPLSCSDSEANDTDGSNENTQEETVKILASVSDPIVSESVTFKLEGDLTNVTSVIWMFGDKNVVTSGAGEAVTHYYEESGDYTINAAMKRTGAKMTQVSLGLTVYPASATIALSNSYPAKMEEVRVSIDGTQNISKVDWSFGDGTATETITDASKQLTHQYSDEGSFTLSAALSFTSGETKTLTHNIEVTGKSLSWSCKNFDKSKIWIMAHRGNTNAGYGLAPNSLAGYQKCIDLGCVDFIETDAQITKDGEVICIHDNYLSRFTDYSSYATDPGYVSQHTLAEIKKYHLVTTDGTVTEESVPTLKEVLTRFRGKVWFNIDKCDQSDVDIEKVYNVVKECGCLDRVQFYISTATDKSKWLSEQDIPGIIAPHANSQAQLTALSIFSPTYMVQLSGNVTNANQAWIGTVNQSYLSVTNVLDDRGTAFLSGDYSFVSNLVAWGINMIQCDYPLEMNAYLEKQGKR